MALFCLVEQGQGQASFDVRETREGVVEPASDGQILSPADVHMQTAAFSDPDPGNTHLCSDWEIWTVGPSPQRVWAASAQTAFDSQVHVHFGDGTFEGPPAGQHRLRADTDYRLRVRFLLRSSRSHTRRRSGTTATGAARATSE